MGLWATWVPVGSLIMFLLAPALNDAFGWRWIWWFSTAFALLAFVLVWFFMKMPPLAAAHQPEAGSHPTRQAPDMKKALSNRSIWLLGASFGFFNMALI
ncbi:MAG TPA: MFS transporter [Anaerolineales bacterium]|nr:MFS transporter [Anaerolineales bacterium]